MMRSSLALVAVLALLGFPSQAFAEEDCPPGAWFCEEQEPIAGAEEVGEDEDAEGDAAEADVAEDAGASEPAAPAEDTPQQGRRPTPAVVYKPADEPPPKIVVMQPTTKKPPPPKRRKRRQFGVNLRLQGVIIGDSSDRHRDAEMGGVGASFRYRPVPHFALDFGLDHLSGTDWEGNERQEGALLISGIVFFNPRDLAQVYTIGGFGFSRAAVQLAMPMLAEQLAEDDAKYSYFGVHLGLGMEFRVSPLVSLNFDLVGFIRGRTDSRAARYPEFVDPNTGRTTNSSGGGLFRGGITFYW